MPGLRAIPLNVIPADWAARSNDFEARLLRAGLNHTPVLEAPTQSAGGLGDSIALGDLIPSLASAHALGEALAGWMSHHRDSRIDKALRCNYAAPGWPTSEEALAAFAAMLAQSVQCDVRRRVPIEVLLQLGDEGAQAAALLRAHLHSGSTGPQDAIDRIHASAARNVVHPLSGVVGGSLAPSAKASSGTRTSNAGPLLPPRASFVGLMNAVLEPHHGIHDVLAAAEKSGGTGRATPFARRFHVICWDFPKTREGRAAAFLELLWMSRELRVPTRFDVEAFESELGAEARAAIDLLTAAPASQEPRAPPPGSFHERVHAASARVADARGDDARLAQLLRGESPASPKARFHQDDVIPSAPRAQALTSMAQTPARMPVPRDAFEMEAHGARERASLDKIVGVVAPIRGGARDAQRASFSAVGQALAYGGGAAIAITDAALGEPSSRLGKMLAQVAPGAAATPAGRAAALVLLLSRYRDTAAPDRVRWDAFIKDSGDAGAAICTALENASSGAPPERVNTRFLAQLVEEVRLLAPAEARRVVDGLVRTNGLIPTSVPALDAVRKATPGGALAGKGLCAVQHLFPTLVPLVEACIDKGMAPADIHILGTPYATNPLVAAYLRVLGVNVTEARDLGGATRGFEEARVQEIGAFLHGVVTSGSAPRAGWKILDDGGLLQGTIAGHKPIRGMGLDASDLARAFPVDRCEAVEQTTRGLTELSKSPILYPTIAVARCEGKMQEGNIIGWCLADALLHELRQTGLLEEARRVTLVSAGTVGLATARHLRDAGFTVTVVDTSAEKRALANDSGFKTASSVQETLSHADVVFSCTGRTALDGEALQGWHGVIASGSSAAIEYNREQINALRDAPIAELNRGRPLNFSGDGYENLSKEQIGITRALLFTALTQPVPRTPGLIDVDEDRDAFAVRVWRRAGGDDTEPLSMDTPRQVGGDAPDRLGPARHDEWMAYLSSLPSAVCPPPNHTGFAPGLYFFAGAHGEVRCVDTSLSPAATVGVSSIEVSGLKRVPRRSVRADESGAAWVLEVPGADGARTQAHVVTMGDGKAELGPGTPVERLLVVHREADPRVHSSWGRSEASSVLFDAGDSLVFTFTGGRELRRLEKGTLGPALYFRLPDHSVAEVQQSPPRVKVRGLLGESILTRHFASYVVPPAFARIDAVAPLDDHDNVALIGRGHRGELLVVPFAAGTKGQQVATLPDGAIFRGMHRPDPHGRPVVFAVDYSLPGDPVELEHFRQHTVTFNWG